MGQEKTALSVFMNFKIAAGYLRGPGCPVEGASEMYAYGADLVHP